MKQLLTQYGGLKREIYILFIGKLVTAMGSFVWPMLTFLLTVKLGFSDGTATFLTALATILSLPAALAGGKLADRFSRKRIIIIFDLATVSLYILASMLPIGFHTAVMVFLGGLFQTLESPAYDALDADFSTPAQREKAFSLSYLGFNLGFVVGASVAGLLFEYHTQLAFLLNGLAVGTSTLLIALFVHMENVVTAEETMEESYGEYEQPVDEKLGILRVLRDRPVVLLMLLIGCFSALPSLITGTLLPLQLKEALGLHGATVYGYLNSLNGFTVILFTPLLTMALKRVTEIPKAALGMVLFISGMTLFAVGGPRWVLFLGMFIYTTGEVCSVLGSNPYNSRRIPASHRGRVGGVSSVAYSVFSSAVQFLVSFVLTASHSNYPMIWMVFIVCCLVVVCLYAVAYRADRRRFPKLYERTDS